MAKTNVVFRSRGHGSRRKSFPIHSVKAKKTKRTVASVLNTPQPTPQPQDERYNGWANHDTWNVMLLLDNSEQSSRWLDSWAKNFKRKQKNGSFDQAKAESVVEKYLIPAAKGKKSLQWAVGRGFTPDPDIDASKVDKAEIVKAILERETSG